MRLPSPKVGALVLSFTLDLSTVKPNQLFVSPDPLTTGLISTLKHRELVRFSCSALQSVILINNLMEAQRAQN